MKLIDFIKWMYVNVSGDNIMMMKVYRCMSCVMMGGVESGIKKGFLLILNGKIIDMRMI